TSTCTKCSTQHAPQLTAALLRYHTSTSTAASLLLHHIYPWYLDTRGGYALPGVCVCSSHETVLSTRRHPAHALSVLILLILERHTFCGHKLFIRYRDHPL
ncbi:unnamed protein product, partial [Laminaria digitata]